MDVVIPAGVDRETPKRVVPEEEIPEPKPSVEGEKEREEKAARPASEGNEATAKEQEAEEAEVVREEL